MKIQKSTSPHHFRQFWILSCLLGILAYAVIVIRMQGALDKYQDLRKAAATEQDQNDDTFFQALIINDKAEKHALKRDGSDDQTPDAIVVGSGLAGLTVTLNMLDRGGRVILLEKEPTVGGNSNKASSGINACCVPQDQGNNDTLALFRNDTIRSAGTSVNYALIDTLVSQSAQAVSWLQDRIAVDLSVLVQLGGHSRKRTHRPPTGMVGAELIFGMLQAVKQYETRGRVRILTGATVTRLLTKEEDPDHVPHAVIGVEYSTALSSEHVDLFAPHVVLATGGFAADRSSHSILSKYRPELVKLPTTAGLFSTGDGVTLATGIGAGLVDMEKIQLHPTGFVDPADPDNGIKVLAAELLRGVGGILLNAEGKRFCNELGTRDYVTTQMLNHNSNYRSSGVWDKNDEVPRFSLVLTANAATEAGKHVDWYIRKGLMTRVTGITGLAKHIHVSENVLRDTFNAYRAYGELGRDSFGKTTFANLYQADDLESEEFVVGTVTPVLHYCMGGITITTQGDVLNDNKQIIPGLHAVGEVTGGVHGVNRLGGNSLLECAVFGSIVGRAIPIHGTTAGNAVVALRRNEKYPDESFSRMEQEVQLLPEISITELERHDTATDCWMAIGGMVYDLTHFAISHPGGAVVLNKMAGKDATHVFDLVHDRKILQSFQKERIGKLAAATFETKLETNAVAPQLAEISMSELSKHNRPTDCWVAFHGIVYDLTTFARKHPGGSFYIHAVAGKDGTAAFLSKHSTKYLALLADEQKGKFVSEQEVQDAPIVPSAHAMLRHPGNNQ